jgi:cephalosporin hydroxylase
VPDGGALKAFHRIYYERPERTWANTRWLGTPVEKCPLDLWIYQEILFTSRPDFVVETGTRYGGSALFIASVLDLLRNGRVISVDIDASPNRPSHPRITYIEGSSTDPDVVERIRGMLYGQVMAVLDSDHSSEHVHAELALYSPMVTPGCYLIVEDTNLNGHPVLHDFGPGPMEALEEFLASSNEFVSDPECEKFMLTFNPRGYLRKVSASSG